MTIIQHALRYAANGWLVFPVPPGTKKSHIKARNGQERWGATRDPDVIAQYWQRWPNANVGVATGPVSGVWVFEIDTTKGHDVDGFASLDELLTHHEPLPDTLTAESPTGSRHLYFKYPPGMNVRNSTGMIGPGLDVRGDGGMVIAPPSLRPDGQAYRWVNSAPVADAPTWLVALVERKQPAPPAKRRDTPASLGEIEELLSWIDPDAGGYKRWQEVLAALNDVTDASDDGLALAEKWSSRGEKYKPGEVADKWRSFKPGGGLSVGTIAKYAKLAGADVRAIGIKNSLMAAFQDTPAPADPVALIMAQVNDNPHEAVPLVAGEVARLSPVDRSRVFDQCRQYGVKQSMQDAVKGVMVEKRKAETVAMGLLNDDKGGPIPNMENIRRILTTWPEWKGTFAFSEFDEMIWVRRSGGDDRRLIDADALRVQGWMQTNIFPHIGAQTVRDAISAAADENRFHPVREYLSGMVWDGELRLGWLFIDYFPCSGDQEYLTAVSRKFSIGAVARIMQPGCKADAMPTISGGQGMKKSSGLAALTGREWFGDDMPDMTIKDAKDWLRGKWIAEMAELSSMRGKDIDHIKSFLTTTHDNYRKAYGHVTETVPRQTVFAGTINAEEYLSDDTGARRFWPLKLRDGMTVQIEAIQADRNQLWAEAMVAYGAGESWWFEPGESTTLEAMQENARTVDIDETKVAAFLRQVSGEVTAVQVAERVFPEVPGGKSLSMRVARYLTALGWMKSRTINGTNHWTRTTRAEPFQRHDGMGNVAVLKLGAPADGGPERCT